MIVYYSFATYKLNTGQSLVNLSLLNIYNSSVLFIDFVNLEARALYDLHIYIFFKSFVC